MYKLKTFTEIMSEFKVFIFKNETCANRKPFPNFRIIHDNGFSSEEAMSKKNLIYGNVIEAMFHILSGMHKLKSVVHYSIS